MTTQDINTLTATIRATITKESAGAQIAVRRLGRFTFGQSGLALLD